MELLNLKCAILILNIAIGMFLLNTWRQVFKYKATMTDGAYHHLLSHAYIASFVVISVNLFFYRGWIAPLIFSSLYALTHVLKENIRLVNTNRWTPSVEED